MPDADPYDAFFRPRTPPVDGQRSHEPDRPARDDAAEGAPTAAMGPVGPADPAPSRLDQRGGGPGARPWTGTQRGPDSPPSAGAQSWPRAQNAPGAQPPWAGPQDGSGAPPWPDAQPWGGPQNPPSAQAWPAPQNLPSAEPWPDAQTWADTQGPPGTQAWPGPQNASGAPPWAGPPNGSGAQDWPRAQNAPVAQPPWAGPQNLPGAEPWPRSENGPGAQPPWPGPQDPPGTPPWPDAQTWADTQSAPGTQAWPGPQNGSGAPPWPSAQNPPGAQAWPGPQDPPGAQAWAGAQNPPGAQAWPGPQDPPGAQAWPSAQRPGGRAWPGTRRGGGTRRWRTPALAALALVLVAGGAYLAGRKAPATTSPPPTQPTAGAAHGARPVMLPAGQVGSRSAVPWSLVGKGWVLAQYTAGANRPTVLYLVDPAGGRYRMYRWPAGHRAWSLIAWSGNGARALLESPGGGRVVLRQLVLARGRTTRFRLPPGTRPAGYTRPDGLNLLAVTAAGGVERFNLNGVLQARLAGGGPRPGAPTDSPNGAAVAIGGGAGPGLVSNAGGKIRWLPVPGVDHKIGCAAVRWWNAATLLATCVSPGSLKAQLWLVPVNRSAPTPLTPVPSATGADNGDLNAWRLSSGLYVQVAGACGSVSIMRQGAGGSLTTVSVPGSPAGNNQVLAVVRGRMLVLARSGCPGSASLLEFTPGTGASKPLLAAPRGGSGVLAAVPYGTPNS